MYNITKKLLPIKIKNAILCCLQKHPQIVGETYIVTAIQPCLICSTLPVEFNRRDRSCLDELFKSKLNLLVLFKDIYTYFFNKKEYNEPLINSMDCSVLFFRIF